MTKILEEFYIPAPWGNIALMTWGNPKGDPILLVHGGEDSAATFIPLMELMPDKYYYVGIDLPGHGKSDPFPPSVLLLRFHFLAAIDVVVRNMRWKTFIYIGHSLGSEIGLYYYAANPGRVSKIIHLDPGLSLEVFFVKGYEEYMTYLASYYDNYSINHGERIYSKRRAVDGVMKARGLTEEQAEIVLSRNLTHIGGDQYKLSWDKRLKFPKPLFLPSEYYTAIFSMSAPPTLLLISTMGKSFTKRTKAGSNKLLADLEKNVKNFYVKAIDGTHDVHLVHPDRLVKHICMFLDEDFNRPISKL